MINIKGINKAEVLKRLYDNSQPLGMGFLQAEAGNMSIEEAESIIRNNKDFDYLKGRVMKVDLSSDEFDPWLYDRDNGQGAAKKALSDLLTGGINE